MVIGGSLAGLAIAVLLAEQGVDVVLLEAERLDQPHGLGAIELNVVEHPHRTAQALGDRVDQLWELTALNKRIASQLGCFEQTGAVWHPGRPNEAEALAASARALESRGIPCKLDDRGLHLPDDGVTPAGVHQHLAELARAHGATVLENRPARLDADPDRVWVGEHAIHTELTVLAAGWGNAALDGRLELALTAVRDAAVSAPAPAVDGLHRRGLGWTSWRSEGDQLTVSGARWATPHLEVGETEPIADPRIVARLRDVLTELGATTEPTIRAWITADSRDHLPLVGPLPSQSRRIVATAFGTNPATWSFAAAHLVVEGILGEAPHIPLISSGRLRRWRF